MAFNSYDILCLKTVVVSKLFSMPLPETIKMKHHAYIDLECLR